MGRGRVHAVAERVLWACAVIGAMVLLTRGLERRIHLEPTSEALAEARQGALWIACACLLLAAAAGYAVAVIGHSAWLAAGVLAPAVLCGGLTWLAPDSLWGVVALALAVPAAASAVWAGLLLPPRPRPRRVAAPGTLGR